MIYHAQWFGSHYYTNGWTSTDGERWFDEQGKPVKISGVTIMFHGGPRDGGRRVF